MRHWTAGSQMVEMNMRIMNDWHQVDTALLDDLYPTYSPNSRIFRYRLYDEWCKQHCPNHWTRYSGQYYFLNKDDGVMFILRWG